MPQIRLRFLPGSRFCILSLGIQPLRGEKNPDHNLFNLASVILCHRVGRKWVVDCDFATGILVLPSVYQLTIW